MVYNELSTLDELLAKCLQLKGSLAHELELIFVDDGSRDGSSDWIENTARQFPDVVPIHHSENKGIGETLYSGYSRATGDWIGSIASDLQFDPLDLMRAVTAINQADIISFYRPVRPDYSRYRKKVSSINRYLNKVLFGLALRDINWTKIYRNWVVAEIPVQSRTPFIESERVILAHKKGARIVEIESEYHLRKAGVSKGSNLKTVIRSVMDLFKFILSQSKLTTS